MDPSSAPDDESLRATLGGTFAGYSALMELAAGFAPEWNFSERSGWMLKIHDRKKALLYLIPLDRSFRVSLTIRETERDTFLRDDDLAGLHDRLAAARKFPEGFAVAFDVAADSHFEQVRLFIGKLIAARA